MLIDRLNNVSDVISTVSRRLSIIKIVVTTRFTITRPETIYPQRKHCTTAHCTLKFKSCDLYNFNDCMRSEVNVTIFTTHTKFGLYFSAWHLVVFVWLKLTTSSYRFEAYISSLKSFRNHKFVFVWRISEKDKNEIVQLDQDDTFAEIRS